MRHATLRVTSSSSPSPSFQRRRRNTHRRWFCSSFAANVVASLLLPLARLLLSLRLLAPSLLLLLLSGSATRRSAVVDGFRPVVLPQSPFVVRSHSPKTIVAAATAIMEEAGAPSSSATATPLSSSSSSSADDSRSSDARSDVHSGNDAVAIIVTDNRLRQRNDGTEQSPLLTNPSNKRFAAVPRLFQCLPPPDLTTLRTSLPPPTFVLKKNKHKVSTLRPTYAVLASYHGPSYPGGYEYQKHNETTTVRGLFTETFSTALGGRKIDLSTAGRTDANVSAKAALFSFVVTSKNQVKARDVDTEEFCRRVNELAAMTAKMVDRGSGYDEGGEGETTHDGDNQMAPFVVHDVIHVSYSFHATFSTVSRQYLYVVPLSLNDASAFLSLHSCDLHLDDDDDAEEEKKGARQSLLVELTDVINGLFEPVVGTAVDYTGMSYGKIKTTHSLCTLDEAKCWLYGPDGSILRAPPCPSTSSSAPSSSGSAAERMKEETEEEEAVPGFGSCWSDVVAEEQQKQQKKNHGRGREDDDESGNVATFTTTERDDGILGSSRGDDYDYTYCLAFRIKSDRFLRRMMRKTINAVLQEAGALLEERGRGRRRRRQEGGGGSGERRDDDNGDDDEWKNRLKARIDSGDRSNNKPAPAEGLCLWRVWVGPMPTN